jgi:hypothetical protein
VRSLREIRDEIAPALLDINEPLSSLLTRGERIMAVRPQARSGQRDQFLDALRIAQRIASLADEMKMLLQQLEQLFTR